MVLKAGGNNVATGTLAIYQGWGLVWIGVISSYSISVVLNLLLTSMIVIRLIRHGRSIHPATGCTGPRVGINGLHKIIATMLVESCALYTAASLLVILPVALDSAIGQLFLPIFFEIQVCAFFPTPGTLDGLSNAIADWTGHRSVAHRQTGRQPERTNEQKYRHRKYRFVLHQEPRRVDER